MKTMKKTLKGKDVWGEAKGNENFTQFQILLE
jgi:hypothetical protein